MKSEELQLVDWISNGKCPIVVDSLNINTHTINGISEDVYKPIPLTKEFFESNSFKDSNLEWFNGNRYIFIHDETHTTITLNHWVPFDGTSDYYTFSFGGADRKVDFVHELQHMLRCCGMNKLANNFIV